MTRDDLLGVELLQEKAWNLGRLARRLERALAALSAFDGESGGAAPTDERLTRRRELIADAGEALFLYVVQREVMRLRGTAAVLDEMRVPDEVRLSMMPRSVSLRRSSNPGELPPARPTGNTAEPSRSSS
jgi:hypothetical protein